MIDKSKLSVVTSPKLFTDNNYERVDEDGLLSQRIFGPIRSWHCACGALRTKTLHEGKTCDVCGVKCESSEMRYKTFAKIVLPFPVFKNIHRARRVFRTIIGNSKYIIDPLQADLSITSSNFLRVDPKTNKVKLVDTYSPQCIPLKITGIYTFYLAIYAAYKFHQVVSCKDLIENIYTYELLVTPPGTRHIWFKPQNGAKELINDDLNLIYEQILKLCSFDWANVRDPKDKERGYLDIIKLHMGSITPVESEDLTFSDQLICRYQFHANQIYKHVISTLSGKEGLIRRDFLGRTVDFSGRSHIIVNPKLKAFEIIIPRKIFMTLWFIEYLHFLVTYKNVNLDDLRPYIRMSENKIDDKYLGHFNEFIEYFFDETKVDFHKRLVLTNRQPTLWRYGIAGVLVVGVSKGDVAELSPLTLDPFNADLEKSPFIQ